MVRVLTPGHMFCATPWNTICAFLLCLVGDSFFPLLFEGVPSLGAVASTRGQTPNSEHVCPLLSVALHDPGPNRNRKHTTKGTLCNRASEEVPLPSTRGSEGKLSPDPKSSLNGPKRTDRLAGIHGICGSHGRPCSCNSVLLDSLLGW